MNEEQLKQRLEERATCEAEHVHLRVAHNGFGWVGTRCSQCGFSFFGTWEPGFGPDLLNEARAALERIETRKGEDVDEWARRLAEDLSKFTD